MCDILERESIALILDKDNEFAGSATNEAAAGRLSYNLRFDFLNVGVFVLGYVRLSWVATMRSACSRMMSSEIVPFSIKAVMFPRL